MLKRLKRLNWFQKLLIFGIVLLIFRSSYFFEFEMKGTYTSNAEEPILEMPPKGEKLFLLENGKYKSTSMGEGTYGIDGARIRLSNGTESWGLPLCREYNIGKPKLMLSGDRAYYMIKD